MDRGNVLVSLPVAAATPAANSQPAVAYTSPAGENVRWALPTAILDDVRTCDSCFPYLPAAKTQAPGTAFRTGIRASCYVVVPPSAYVQARRPSAAQ